MAPLLLAAAAWGLLKSRLAEPPRTQYATHENLVQAFLFGEFVRPTERVNFGSPRGQQLTLEADPRRASLATGVLTRSGGKPPFALVVGREAGFDLDVIEPTDRRLVLRLSSAFTDRPQTVSVRFNDTLLGSHELRKDGESEPLRFDVPGTAQVRGRNRVELRFAEVETVTLHDLPGPLPLSARLVSCHFLRPGESEDVPPSPEGGLRPGVIGSLGVGGETRRVVVPAGVSGRVSAELPEGSRVVLRFRAERIDTSLELSLLTDDGRRVVLTELDHRDVLPRDVLEDLTPWAGRTVQLDFWSRDGEGGTELSAVSVLVPAADALGAEAEVAPVALDLPEPGAGRGRLVVVLDALAAGRTSAYGAERPTTPVLEQLARRALVAPDALAPASYTVASVGTLFTGLHPVVHGVVLGETQAGTQVLADDAPTLAARLSSAGWRTAAWITNPNASARYGYARGFDRYEELFSDPDLWVPGAGVDGAELVPRLAAFLGAEPGRPFLAWVHAFEPHAPWRAPDDLTATFVSPYDGQASGEREWLDGYRVGSIDPATVTPVDLAHLAQLYAARVASADRVLGSLLGALDASGRAADTAILVIADHGEALGEHGRLEHGDDVHVEQLHVPFVLWLPGRGAGTLAGPVSLADVMPTLLGLAGLAAPPLGDGVDLLAELPDAARPRLSRGYGTRPAVGLVRGRWSVQFDSYSRRLELFDRETDPQELHDLADELPVTASLAHAELCRELAALRSRARDVTAQGEVDPEQLQVLKSLGYVGSGEGDARTADDALLLALRSRLMRD